jgi:hypothetical protein
MALAAAVAAGGTMAAPQELVAAADLRRVSRTALCSAAGVRGRIGLLLAACMCAVVRALSALPWN